MENISNIVLFTGAGFTKNYGGFLASEMWSKIFNDKKVQDNQNLRTKLKENLNFEDVISDILLKGIKDEIITVQEATKKAYNQLDENICKNQDRTDSDFFQRNTKHLSSLTKAGKGNVKGLWFTLNQDLFLERLTGISSVLTDSVINHHQSWDSPITPYVMPHKCSEEEILKAIESHSGTSYVKLHGSIGWSSQNAEGMILGVNKKELIDNEPLLKEYFSLFEKILERNETKLLMIGYGFKDDHINKILIKAALAKKLKLYFVSPKPTESFKGYLEETLEKWSTGSFNVIWEAMSGYFEYSMRDIFGIGQLNQVKATAWNEIVDSVQN